MSSYLLISCGQESNGVYLKYFADICYKFKLIGNEKVEFDWPLIPLTISEIIAEECHTIHSLQDITYPCVSSPRQSSYRVERSLSILGQVIRLILSILPADFSPIAYLQLSLISVEDRNSHRTRIVVTLHMFYDQLLRLFSVLNIFTSKDMVHAINNGEILKFFQTIFQSLSHSSVSKISAEL